MIVGLLKKIIKLLRNIPSFPPSNKPNNKLIPAITAIKSINYTNYIHESVNTLWAACFNRFPIWRKTVRDITRDKENKGNPPNSNKKPKNITVLSHSADSITMGNIDSNNKKGGNENEIYKK